MYLKQCYVFTLAMLISLQLPGRKKASRAEWDRPSPHFFRSLFQFCSSHLVSRDKWLNSFYSMIIYCREQLLLDRKKAGEEDECDASSSRYCSLFVAASDKRASVCPGMLFDPIDTISISMATLPARVEGRTSPLKMVIRETSLFFPSRRSLGTSFVHRTCRLQCIGLSLIMS